MTPPDGKEQNVLRIWASVLLLILFLVYWQVIITLLAKLGALTELLDECRPSYL